jgi:hypothetical protein
MAVGAADAIRPASGALASNKKGDPKVAFRLLTNPPIFSAGLFFGRWLF